MSGTIIDIDMLGEIEAISAEALRLGIERATVERLVRDALTSYVKGVREGLGSSAPVAKPSQHVAVLLRVDLRDALKAGGVNLNDLAEEGLLRR